MSYRYVIIGAGRQGTAAAFDLIRYGEAARIIIADRDLAQAEAAAARVNQLTETSKVEATRLEASDLTAAKALMMGADVVLSAVPYYFNLALTDVAIEAGVNFVDMGGHTGIVREQLERHERAREAGVVILPDCGMGPGLVNVIAVRAMELLDETDEILIADGGLPQAPEAPWNYQCSYNLNGLTNEYDGVVPLLKDGEIYEAPALSDCVTLELKPWGTFEAFIAAGGSTAAWSFKGRLKRFETRVLRYPGHFEWFKGFQTLGLFREDLIEVNGQQIAPRDVYHALLAPFLTVPLVKDICLMRCTGKGRKDGQAATVEVDVVDRYDPSTGFTGMERLTGWSCAIMMGCIARGQISHGARALEIVLLEGSPTAGEVLAETARRGIEVSTRQL